MNPFNPLFLQASIFVPLIAAFVLIIRKPENENFVRSVALLGFIVPALCSVWLFFEYNVAAITHGGYAFYSNIDTGLNGLGISLKLGLNGISAPLYLLAGIVGLAAGYHAIITKVENISRYLVLLLLMQAGLMGVFASIDIFFFFFFHEFALVPTFIMIGVWGGKGRRTAAMEMTVYLTLGALITLVGLIALYVSCGIGSFDLISLKQFLAKYPLLVTVENNIFPILLIGFGILVSLFPFHSWAPRGYAAAPTPTAMMHAGVLKKFGLYGLIQIAAPLLPQGAANWSFFLAILALCNVFILGLVTTSQRDLKQMIGYSSVMHMGYCFLGIVTLSTIGIGGTILLMFAHGLSVALLFLMSSLLYKRTQTFDMTAMGGLYKKTPILAAFFLTAIMANIGLPGFANFWGELTIFISLWEYSHWMTFVAIFGIVISAVYGLRAMAWIFMGKPRDSFKDQYNSEDMTDISIAERVPAVLLIATLVIIGFWPRPMSDFINDELKTTVYEIKSIQQ